MACQRLRLASASEVVDGDCGTAPVRYGHPAVWRRFRGRHHEVACTREHGFPFELQIRTEEMHRHADQGIAAHWKYKEGRIGAHRDERCECACHAFARSDADSLPAYTWTSQPPTIAVKTLLCVPLVKNSTEAIHKAQPARARRISQGSLSGVLCVIVNAGTANGPRQDKGNRQQYPEHGARHQEH